MPCPTTLAANQLGIGRNIPLRRLAKMTKGGRAPASLLAGSPSLAASPAKLGDVVMSEPEPSSPRRTSPSSAPS